MPRVRSRREKTVESFVAPATTAPSKSSSVPSCTSPRPLIAASAAVLRLHRDVAPVSAAPSLVYARPMRTAKILATALAVATAARMGLQRQLLELSNPPDDANNLVKGTPIETASRREAAAGEKPDPQAEAKKKYDEATHELEAAVQGRGPRAGLGAQGCGHQAHRDEVALDDCGAQARARERASPPEPRVA